MRKWNFISCPRSARVSRRRYVVSLKHQTTTGKIRSKRMKNYTKIGSHPSFSSAVGLTSSCYELNWISKNTLNVFPQIFPLKSLMRIKKNFCKLKSWEFFLIFTLQLLFEFNKLPMTMPMMNSISIARMALNVSLEFLNNWNMAGRFY